MALQAELLSILSNSEEPLPKRLRIASDVFNSNELPTFDKESVVFNWMGDTCSKTDLIDAWITLNDFITSPQMKGISANEIKHNVLHAVVKAVIKQLKKQHDENYKKNVLNCGIAILNNETFQQYFKHDLKQFCELVAKLLLHTEDLNTIKGVITVNLSFIDKNFDKNVYMKHFSAYIFDALVTVIMKLKDDDLFKQTQLLIKRAMFPTSSNDFLHFLTTMDTKCEDTSNNIIFEKLQSLYNSDTQTAKFGFKIIFLTSLSVCSTEILRYKLFILFLHLIGFKVQKITGLNLVQIDNNFDLENSLEILSGILEIIHIKNVVINEKINNVTFSDLLKSLTVSIVRLQTQPSLSTLIILKYIIDIDPLIIETSISEVIAFITLIKKDENSLLAYSELMISITKMYFKLHRVGKFYSQLLETIHKKICSDFNTPKPEIKFLRVVDKKPAEYTNLVQDVFPEKFLQFLQDCITLQHSSEVTVIMRTSVYNLKQISDSFQFYTEDGKVFFIQIVSEIFCNILCGVKLADDNSSEYSQKRFIDDLNNLREVLQKFGTALLTVEHNPLIMFSFLNICYTWAEVCLLLAYYTNAQNLNFKGEIENDNSSSDLIYLHSYLTSEQWSLILQRIKNFGEQPCKHILQKLLIQKLRAIKIFEKEAYDTTESFIISNYATNLDISWDIILDERIIATTFIQKMDSSQLINLSRILMNYIFEKNDFEFLERRFIIDARQLMTAIFYVSLSKISDLFRRKRKHGESMKTRPVCTRIFKDIDEDSFIKNEVVNMEQITKHFNDFSSEIKDFQINETSFFSYMQMIKYVPVIGLDHDVQVTLFFFLLSICYEFRNTRAQNMKCLQKCEEYLIALVEDTHSPNILKYIQSDILVKCILESVQQYKTLLTFIIKKSLAKSETIPSFDSTITLLETNLSDDKYLETIFSVIHIITNASLKKVEEENKPILDKYKDKLLKKLRKFIFTDESINDNKTIAYVLLLNHYLNNDIKDNLVKLIPLAKKYIDYAANNINENNSEQFLLLFKLILFKKEDFTDSSENINMITWNTCKNLTNIDKLKDFEKIITLIFQDSSIKEFSNILQELHDKSLASIKSNDVNCIINQLKIWRKLVHATFPKNKAFIVANNIQILLQNLVVFLINNNNQEFNEEFVQFQTDILKTTKFTLSSTIIDVNFHTTLIFITKETSIDEFITAFKTSVPILECFARHRNELLVDRLPTFLQHLRLFLRHLCSKSNSDVELKQECVKGLIDCAFKMEKIVRIICKMKKDLVRITPNLIADFLKEYEQIALYPDVKFHLNNCLMELIGLLDDHGVQYLLRVLSPASTELFKELHDYYKKYYKYTGKV